eukprot:10273765-Lingulodinium_polyedra.AAC.1
MHVWQIAATASAASGLMQLRHRVHKKHCYKVMARVLPPAMQAAVFAGNTEAAAWKTLVRALRNTLLVPEQFRRQQCEGVCYLAFSSASHVWYVGKASSARARNG